jgi:hypothetical protein
MQEIHRQGETNLNNGERIISPLALYSSGLMYFTVMMRGFSQAGLYLLGSYARPGSFSSPRDHYNGYSRLTASPDEPSGIKLLNGNDSLNGRDGILSSIKQLTEGYFLLNAPSVFQTLLELICLAYSSNVDLRRHIRNIKAKYMFCFRDHDKHISLEIKNGGMRVFQGNIDLPDVSLTFRNSKALRDLLFADKPDILEAILKQDVEIDGNLTYIFKFIYLVRHLQMKLIGQA